MTEPGGTVVRRGAAGSSGAMAVSEESVMAYVNAYRKYADEMDDLIWEIKTSIKKSTYGNLESLRQLADGYFNLMVTGDESLVGRLTQFSEQARQIAQKILDDWRMIQDQDAASSAALNATGL